MLEVAVIGAGAAGLVASRNLISQGLKPCIFDAAKTVGGAWSAAAAANEDGADLFNIHNKNENDSNVNLIIKNEILMNNEKMWDGLHTNISKYTCRFSDWPWPADTPTFPSAVAMHQYLESYAYEFLINHDPTTIATEMGTIMNSNGCSFQFQCQVTNISLIPSLLQPEQIEEKEDVDSSSTSSSSSMYRVEWIDLTSQTKHSKDFEGVVVATGFFSKPHFPQLMQQEEEKPDDYHPKRSILHSSEYKSADDFVNESVAVIGNSFSAMEIAASVSKTAKSVVNVIPTIPWIVPRYVVLPPSTTTTSSKEPSSTSSSSPSLPIPVDLAFYRRSKPVFQGIHSSFASSKNDNENHNDDDDTNKVYNDPSSPSSSPPSSSSLLWTVSFHERQNLYLKSIFGNRQSQYLTKLQNDNYNNKHDKNMENSPINFFSQSNMQRPIVRGTSDDYLECVLQDRIQVHIGRWVGYNTQQQKQQQQPSSSEQKNDHDNNDDIQKETLQLIIDQSDITNNDNNNSSSSSSSSSSHLLLDDITKVICCTGYRTNLEDFLDESILNILQYNNTSSYASYFPMVTCWDTFHPKLPNFAFCGMYKGPYMGVMELQGRLAAKVIAASKQNNNNNNNNDDDDDDCDDDDNLPIWKDPIELDHALEISERIRNESINNQDERPQFPHGDYIGFMDTLTHVLYGKTTKKKKNPNDNTVDDVDIDDYPYPKVNIHPGDIVCPAFYQPNMDLALQALEEIEQEEIEVNGYKRLPRLVLNTMIGKWKYRRTIIHYNDNCRQEQVYGTIRYSRVGDSSNSESSSNNNIKTTKDNGNNNNNDDNKNDNDDNNNDFVLYREDGIYEYAPGKEMDVFREYAYIVNDKMGVLDIYFVEGGKRTYLFMSLKFTADNNNNNNHDNSNIYVATSDHLCVKDLYKGTFQVRLEQMIATEIIMTYHVKGPFKDYVSTTILTPCA